jgi:1,4-dihydroxy-2-naphthoate octaprenyltransferase
MSGLFDYLEIRTKITSVLPFLMTLAYLALKDRPVDPLRSGVFFAGMLLFDLTATAINNCVDMENTPRFRWLSPGNARRIVLGLLALSTGLGLWLVALTDGIVLLAGALCFAFGILYSWGPLPLSHSPFSEAASGFFYGVMIPFILIRINDPGYIVTYGLTAERISVHIDLVSAAGFALLAVLPFCLTAGIMLANNICDAQHDICAGRRTLAFYLRDRALPLFDGLYYIAYLSVAVMVAFGFLPALNLALFLTLIPVRRNLRLFRRKQTKEETFSVSIRNFVLILSAHTALLFAGGMLPTRSAL